MAEWLLRFDGLYEPRYRRDGVATFGFVVERDGERVHAGKGLVAGPGAGANAASAEFGALIMGLLWLRERGVRGGTLRVEGDSRLVCETVAGRWRLASERLKPMRDVAVALLDEMGPATIGKVSRETNAEADRLSREAYHEAVAAHPEWGIRREDRARSRSRDRGSA